MGPDFAFLMTFLLKRTSSNTYKISSMEPNYSNYSTLFIVLPLEDDLFLLFYCAEVDDDLSSLETEVACRCFFAAALNTMVKSRKT